jgi:biotin--protein ligase
MFTRGLLGLFVLFVCCGVCCAFSSNSAKKTVYVYEDAGVSEESLAQTLHSLQELLAPRYLIKTLNAKEVIANQWAKDAALFVMPGGADLPYLKKLKGQGNQNIKEYVQAGGAYLGFCAGAYYGASAIEFDKGGALEVFGQRELGFYPGVAVGPILAPYVYHSAKGARAPIITPTIPGLKKTAVFYNGGGTFLNPSQYPGIKVLAYYPKGEAAVVEAKVQKGRAILSGVHPEYSANLIDEKEPELEVIKCSLQRDHQARAAFLKALLERLLKR